MEEPTRFENLTKALTTPNEDLDDKTPLEAARDCGMTGEEMETAIDLLTTNPAAYSLPQESDACRSGNPALCGSAQ